MRRKVARVVGALLAMAAVVLLPSEAWGASSWSYTFDSRTGSGGTVVMSSGANDCFNAEVLPADTTRTYVGLHTVRYDAGTGLFLESWSQIASGNSTTYSLTSCTGTVSTMADGSYRVNQWGRASASISGTAPAGWVVYDQITYKAGTVTVAASTCSAGTYFPSAQAAYTSGTLGVRFGPSVASANVGPWKVQQISAVGGYVVNDLGTVQGADFQPNTYPGVKGADISTYANPPAVRISRSSAPGCYVDVAVSAGSVSVTDPNLGMDESGNSCGWNPLCYFGAALRAAFYPSESLPTMVSDHVSTWTDHFPVNVMAAGTAGVLAFRDVMECVGDTSTCGGTPGYSAQLGINDAEHNIHVTPFGSTGGVAHGGSVTGPDSVSGALSPLRTAMTWLLWVGAAWWMWSRVSRSFGGKA